jgi:hypothetical protein
MENVQKKIAFSFFVDEAPKFKKQALRIIYSLLRSGRSEDQIFITYNEDIDEHYVALLRDNLNIRNLFARKIFTTESRPANKWLQLCDVDFGDSTHIILNDTDKVYLDFDDGWANDSIRACKFVPRPTFTVFENILSCFELPKPRFFLDKPDPRDEKRDQRNYVNNHNGGMIIIPADKLAQVTSQWKYFIDALGERTELLGPNVRNLDQVAFALTMASLGIDINHLPKTLDIGLGVSNISPHIANRQSGQFILHVHGDEDNTSTITCRETTHATVRDIVTEFNADYHTWLKHNGLYDYCFDHAEAA